MFVLHTTHAAQRGLRHRSSGVLQPQSTPQQGTVLWLPPRLQKALWVSPALQPAAPAARQSSFSHIVFPPKSVLHTAICLQTPLISLKLRFPSLHMHTMYSLYSAGDKEKRGRGPIPLQEMLIRLFQPAPFKMYCYGPINCTPRGDIPQINDYLRISHASVQKAHGWLCRKDYCSTDEYR